MRIAGLALLVAASLLPLACDSGDWPDRDPVVIDRAPVDSLEFLPRGSRFILADSLTPVRVSGFRLGYACTRILSFGLVERTAAPSGWSVRLSLRLPAAPTCAVDTGTSDSVLTRRFAASEGPAARLVDSLGAVLDSARIVRGTLAFDSLSIKAGALAAFRGRFHYRDTAGVLRRELASDSLGPCEALNHAEFRRKGDTTVVRFSWVTLDAAFAPDSCSGPVGRDAIEPVPSLP